jgi:hypothetical protein
VIYGRYRQVRAPHTTIGDPQTLKRLRRSYFVNQMQIDVEESGLAFGLAHNVRIPNLFEQSHNTQE